MMATAAEIARVSRICVASAEVLAIHVPDMHGLCASCRDRHHPCSRRLHAQRSARWATRRIDEINAELDGRSWLMLLTPTMCLPVVA